MRINLKFEQAVDAELKNKQVTLTFGNREEAEKFFIGLSEAARMKNRISLTVAQVSERKIPA